MIRDLVDAHETSFSFSTILMLKKKNVCSISTPLESSFQTDNIIEEQEFDKPLHRQG